MIGANMTMIKFCAKNLTDQEPGDWADRSWLITTDWTGKNPFEISNALRKLKYGNVSYTKLLGVIKIKMGFGINDYKTMPTVILMDKLIVRFLNDADEAHFLFLMNSGEFDIED